MSGTLKTYQIKAYLFREATDESHWQEWDFDVTGLSTLPAELFKLVNAFLLYGHESTVHFWTTRRMPMLRNSLSYNGEHGVTGFPITLTDGTQHKIRVFAFPKTPADVFTFNARVCHANDEATTLREWNLDTADLFAMVGAVRADVYALLGVEPAWTTRGAYAKLRSAMRRHGTGETSCIVTNGPTDFLVKFKATKHA